MKNAIPHSIIAIAILSLSGCFINWKTIGKVDMSKLVSLEEVWNNPEKYLGKVVTVGLDTVVNSFKGGRTLATGEQYSVAGLNYNCRYLKGNDKFINIFRTYIDSVGGRDSAIGDTIFCGNYEICFIFDDTKPPVWPGWINGNLEYLRLEIDSKDWAYLERKPKKYMSGILLGCTHLPSEIDWVPDLKKLNMFKDFREIILMPLGYKYQKGPEIKTLMQ